MKHLVLATLLVAGVATLAAQPAARLARLPLQKTPIRFESPKAYQMPERIDRKTGRVVTYDPRPRVVTLDARAGLVAFKWIGQDGGEKTIVYQREDAIDVILRASVVPRAAGAHEYVYEIESLPSSGESLSGFAVQTFTTDITPIVRANLHIGRMKARSPEEGAWLRFAPLSNFSPQVTPGRKVTFGLKSPAPPALLECRVHGGAVATKGVGEEMPAELSALLPGYKTWPHGYTIGPDDRLRPLSQAQRAQKLLEWLPEFERLGWMTRERRSHYATIARRGDLRTLAAEAGVDLRAELITTEVRAILQGFVTAVPAR